MTAFWGVFWSEICASRLNPEILILKCLEVPHSLPRGGGDVGGGGDGGGADPAADAAEDAEEGKQSKYQRKNKVAAKRKASKGKKDQNKKQQLGLGKFMKRAAEDIAAWTQQGFAKLPKPPVWEEAAKDPTNHLVTLFRNDCHPLLCKQIFSEWNARAVVVWTTGQGTALMAAQEERLPALGFTLNQPHHDVVRHWLESACAKTVVEAFVFVSGGVRRGGGGIRGWGWRA